MTDGTTGLTRRPNPPNPGPFLFFCLLLGTAAPAERYSFDSILICRCCTAGITNVIIHLKNITQYSQGRGSGHKRLHTNCCSTDTAHNLITSKRTWKWGNAFLLNVTSQGQGVGWIILTWVRLRSSLLFCPLTSAFLSVFNGFCWNLLSPRLITC